MRLRGLLFVLVGLVVLGVVPGGAFAAGACSNEGLREAQGSTFLPECRAYEMVSPPDKNGGDVLGVPLRTRSAADGNGIVFSSYSAFANARGTSTVVEYLARRGAQGWSINAITPPQDPVGFIVPSAGAQARLVGDLSSDLSTGVMFANRPLTSGAPNVEKAANLYLRTDIGESPGSYELLSNSVNLLAPFFDVAETNLYAVGSSVDFVHVIFETRNNLTPDASGNGWKLYEFEHGTVRLVGILPDGTPLPEAWAGNHGGHEIGPGYTTNMISQDGSRIFFTDPSTHNIYVRENHSTTTQLNVDEWANPSPGGSAELWSATPDGSQVFFITSERLTEDSNGFSDLYRYDFNAPSGHRLTLLSRSQAGYENTGVMEVLGVSEDGSYVYFTQGALGGFRRLFVWHNGVIHFVGTELRQLTGVVEGAGALRVATSQPHGSAVRVVANGVLVYTTNTPQTSYDTLDTSNEACVGAESRCDEVYRYDPAVGSSVCVSCNPSGASPAGDALFTLEAADRGIAVNALSEDQHLPRPVSDDGSRVFFDSPDALVAQDTNRKYDVYEYDVATHEVHLISGGQSNVDSVFLEVSPDGRNVFFTTRQQLVGQDGDTNSDLYDARVEGGIASQDQRPVAGCAGDGCQGSLSVAPAVSAPSSSALSGSGNLPAPVSAPVVKAKPHVKKKSKARKRKAARHKRRGKAKRARASGMSASRRAGR